MGGVEGIQWIGNIIATCSSDVTVNVINMEKIKISGKL